MTTFLLHTAGSVVASMYARKATAASLEWLLFKVAEAIVQSTETKQDDQWLQGFKEGYEQSKRT